MKIFLRYKIEILKFQDENVEIHNSICTFVTNISRFIIEFINRSIEIQFRETGALSEIAQTTTKRNDFYDEKEKKNYNINWLRSKRKKIGIGSQEPLLFEDEYVCNLFGIHNFLMTLKYNLNIYENGINIKVGQKKIEFSRAFIKQSKPKYFLLNISLCNEFDGVKPVTSCTELQLLTTRLIGFITACKFGRHWSV
ncbi:hypothetical protein U3516DRAFT_770545 [Neocallimastix sp. 'constans']